MVLDLRGFWWARAPDAGGWSNRGVRAFVEKDPVRFPGATAISVSRAVLEDLRNRGETFTAMLGSILGGAAGVLIGLGDLLKGVGKEALKDLNLKMSGTLKRVATSPVSILVNDSYVALPVIRAQGRLGDEDTEWVSLDDVANPLMLRFRIGNESLEVVKISFPSDTTTKTIQSTLEQKGRIAIYGVYFDFGSDRIREESEPTLSSIAAMLTSNRRWNAVTVEGHTDAVGSDAANRDQSRRRAAAVRPVLVERFGIPPARLTSAGFGASRPQAANDTLEGRARNRRIELTAARSPARSLARWATARDADESVNML